MPEETEEQKAQREAQEKEQARQEQFRKSEEARVRAEAERDAFKAVLAEKGSPIAEGEKPWTDEQWAAFTEKTGMTKDQVVVSAQIADKAIETRLKQYDARVTAAEKRAEEAEKRASRADSSRLTDSIRRDFLAERPSLARYQKHIDEFLADYSEADRADPEKLKRLLDKAAVYVRGKVGEKDMKNGPTGGPRLDRGTEPDVSPEEIDTEDLEDHHIAVVRGAAARTQGRQIEGEDVKKDSRGLKINTEADWSNERKKTMTFR